AEHAQPAAHTPIEQLMTHGVPCVRADLSAESLAAFLVARNLQGAPVVDGAGALIGFVSLADLVRDHVDNGDTAEGPLRLRLRGGGSYNLGDGFHYEEEFPGKSVGDVMERDPIALPPSAPVARAAAVMAFEELPEITVVDGDRIVVGVVSAIDVLRWMATQ